MVVSAATNCASENEGVREWLAEYRRRRTTSLIERLANAEADGELALGTDTQMLGNYFATILHGLSVQARDGVPKKQLLAMLPAAMRVFDGG